MVISAISFASGLVSSSFAEITPSPEWRTSKEDKEKEQEMAKHSKDGQPINQQEDFQEICNSEMKTGG